MVKRRWGFLLGLAACLLAVSWLSRFLLVIEVTGNETVPTAVILSQLQRVGVKPGAYGPAIAQREAANEALLGLPELSYMAINIYGTRAEIIVREAEKVPEMLDEDIPADIVATSDGMIEDIHADTGRAMFADGDIVAKGEVLISGTLDLKEPEYGTVDFGYMVVRAVGDVTARTWRTLEETIPLTVQVKEYTGEESRGYGIKFLWFDLDFFENSSISQGDCRADPVRAHDACRPDHGDQAGLHPAGGAGGPGYSRGPAGGNFAGTAGGADGGPSGRGSAHRLRDPGGKRAADGNPAGGMPGGDRPHRGAGGRGGQDTGRAAGGGSRLTRLWMIQRRAIP